MKIGVDIGHNVAHDGGAHGIVQEDTWTREVGLSLMTKLKNAGHTVVGTLPLVANDTTDALRQRTDVANREKVQYLVSVHFNAGGGTGSEVLYKTPESKAFGQKILDELGKIFPVRKPGMVYRDNLWLFNHATMPCVIVESLFVDNAADVKLYNADKIAEAIFRGITGQPSTSTKPANVVTPAAGPAAKLSQNDVKNLQLAINVMDIRDNSGAKLVVDGQLGPKTREAVAKLDKMVNEILK